MNCMAVPVKGKSCPSNKDQSQRLNRGMGHDTGSRHRDGSYHSVFVTLTNNTIRKKLRRRREKLAVSGGGGRKGSWGDVGEARRAAGRTVESSKNEFLACRTVCSFGFLVIRWEEGTTSLGESRKDSIGSRRRRKHHGGERPSGDGSFEKYLKNS